MTATDVSAQIGETAHRMFADLADPQSIIAGREGWREELWSAIEDALLSRAWACEAMGGAGLGSRTVGAIAAAAGSHALAVPLVETMTAHHWAARAGIELADGIIGLAPSRMSDRLTISSAGKLSGNARNVPCVDGPMLVVTEQGDRVACALIDAVQGDVVRVRSGAGVSRADVRLRDLEPQAMGYVEASQRDVMASAAAMRAAQMGGALRWLLDAAVTYAGERRAFGRPIAKFQAIQHHLARLAGETCATEVASAVALDALDCGPAHMEAAAAKVRADDAATEGAAIAHQVFGAIGFTAEHVLQRYTRQLLAWRDDFGSGSEWAVFLGNAAAASTGRGFWHHVAGGHEPRTRAGG